MSLSLLFISKDVPLSAAGKYTAKTNQDETECTLRVVPVNKFLKDLEDQTCQEGDQVIFECQMGDDEAEAEWTVNSVVIQESERFQVKRLEKGVHKLIILRARIEDTGDVVCKCVGQNETKASLMVNKKGRALFFFLPFFLDKNPYSDV